MTIKSTIARAINSLLHPFNLHVASLSGQALGGVRLNDALWRLKLKKIDIATVIDVGASNGCWTERVMQYFPSPYFHLIEANAVHEESLAKLVARHSNCGYTIAAAADTVGAIYFDDSDPFTGQAKREDMERKLKKVACTTIDHEVSDNGLTGPYLVKLDTHGFEVPIFDGAEKTLQNTNLIIVETYNFDLTEDSLKFWEMCDFLVKRGFRPIDIMEPMFRPRDKAFWQIDFVFAKADRPEFQSNAYA